MQRVANFCPPRVVVARLQPPQHVCHVGVARVEEGRHDGAWVQHKNGVPTPLLLFDTPVAAFTF